MSNEKQELSFKDKMKIVNEENEKSSKVDEATKEAVNKEEKQKEQDGKEKLFNLISKNGGPDKAQIEEWKAMYNGRIYVIPFEDNNFFIYRYIARPEWNQLKNQFKSVQNPNIEDLVDESIFKKCVLFPTVDDSLLATVGGGTIQSVASAIRFSSDFIPESLIVELINKL